MALVVVLSGLLYSASRGGLLSFIIAAAVMIGVFSATQQRGRGAIVGSLTAVAILIVVVVILGGDGVIRRSLAFLSEGDTDRHALFALTIKAIELRPWTGWGIGSFETIYSLFQPASLATRFDKAHNTYLETVLELGIPVSVLLLTAILALAIRCLRGLRERTRDVHYSAIGFGVTILVGVHSLVDFGIQIPANAIVFSTLLGVGWAQSWSSRRPTDE